MGPHYNTTRDQVVGYLTAIHEVDIRRALPAAIVLLCDTLRPAVEAFVEATKVGGAFGPRGR